MFIDSARKVLEIEKQAIAGLLDRLDEQFVTACKLMQECNGRIIVIGMGKSGHIGNKIAATLASTGTPAFFVHPGEASHGDLGMIMKNDLILMISNSGSTAEIVTIIPVIKRIGTKIIAMTGNTESVMAKLADVHICTAVEKEACPLGLAPTASTTATLAMGDAIAVSLLEARGFTAEDFALSHPGGRLGKRLLLSLHDIMHSGDEVPIVNEQALVKDALIEITKKRLGMTAVVNSQGVLMGLFTDGDLRRILGQQVDIHSTRMSDVMTVDCVTASADMLAAEALNIMESKRINGMIIVDDQNTPIGALNMQDLLTAGVI